MRLILVFVLVALVSGINVKPIRFRSSRVKRTQDICTTVANAVCVAPDQLDSQCSEADYTRDTITYSCDTDGATCCLPHSQDDQSQSVTLASESQSQPQSQAESLGDTPISTPVSTTVADTTVSADPAAARTAIWFHGMQTPLCPNSQNTYCGCVGLKQYIHYLTRTDVITPISPTDDGGAEGTSSSSPHGLCYLWNSIAEPWAHPAPNTAELTVSGYSLGRTAFFKFIQNHGFPTNPNGDTNANYFPNLKRAVLFDPSYEGETYTTPGGTPKKGLEVVADWLQADSTRVFVFAYGGATIDKGITNWKNLFIDGTQYESLRPQIFVVNDIHLYHFQIPEVYSACLFDNTCAGVANHQYSSSTYRSKSPATEA